MAAPRGVYEMAAYLLLEDTPFSRNRNFEAYDDPRFRPAIALYKRLRALLSDLERAAKDGTRLALVDDGRRVRLDFASERYTRTAYVDKPAWNVLLMHPRARSVVDALAHEEHP